MRAVIKAFFVIVVVVQLYGCGSPTTQQLALKNGFASKYIHTENFNLASYIKISHPGSVLNVYIEGDGNAFSNWRVNLDPSPKNSTTMQLASLDSNFNVAYLARPCQYSPGDLVTVCEEKYWSTARYSEIVVRNMDEAINKLKRLSQARKIHLIGYSGGGALAILIAARRNDIASIRTVAGNLDLQAMDKYHNTTPLRDSLDPINYAQKVSHIPQIHFIGAKDTVVPTYIAQNFQNAAKLKAEQVIIIDKISHNKGWDKIWPQLLLLNTAP